MTQPTDGPAATARAQVLNLIDFLSAYDAQRHPPIRKIEDHGMFRLTGTALPDHPAVRVRPTEQAWLAVDFIDLPVPPEPPIEVAEFLVGGADVVAGVEPQLVPPPPEPPTDETADAEPVAAEQSKPGAADAQQRWSTGTQAAQAWIETTWRPWSAQWKTAQAVKQLHRNLFEQRERLVIDRDAVELVWGFGRLRWTDETDDDRTTVDHPLLTVPVEIDAVQGSEHLQVRPAGPLEVEGRPLIGLDVHDRSGYSVIRQTVAGDPIDPWVEADRNDILRRLVRAVDDEGGLVEVGATRSERATVDNGWTLFLRRKVPDSEGFLQAMREIYVESLESIPPPLRSMLTTEEQTIAGGEGGESEGVSSSPVDPLLLPLAANEQQQRILHLAQRHPGVAVQGPPGTGKSHTIANLISHYVAYGKRVLVVAEKEQALKVLADKVPEGIRDLTVSVLGADEEGRKRLGQSISRIQTRVGQVDRSVADARIVELTAVLDTLDRRYADVTTQLLRTRQAEVSDLPGNWPVTPPVTPQAAAAWVAENQDQFSYIPDPIPTSGPPPVTSGELAELLELLRTVSLDKAHRAGDSLPDRGHLPTPADLQRQLHRLSELGARADRARHSIRDWNLVTNAGDQQIRTLTDDLIRERDWYLKLASGWLGRVLEQLRDPLMANEWAGFTNDLRRIREETIALRTAVRPYTIQLPEPINPQFVTDLTSARDKLTGGGKLGMFAKDAKRATEACRVDGVVPTTLEQVQRCLDVVNLRALRYRIGVIWDNQTRPLGAPALVGSPEQTIGDRLDELDEVRSSQQRWSALTARLSTMGFPIPQRPNAEAFEQAASLCQDALAGIEQDGLRGELRATRDALVAGAHGVRPSPAWLKLADAVVAGGVAAYRQEWDAVEQLEAIARPAARLTELHQRLIAVAPQWAAAIGRDATSAGRPGDLGVAWQWRQLETWLAEIAALPDPAELQAVLEELTLERRRTVTELVTERAWRRLADNLGHRERQALQSYVAAVTRYGKTGGKFAQRWISEMRAALDDAKTAVPVWIMPTARALTSFRPTAVPPFDVLVIDEASQIGFEAMPLLALASATIVVGDDKQTSPEHVGLDRQTIFDLMDDYLRDIPRYKTVFDPDRSLYDLATLRFSTPVMLTEHFRCLPEIIAFSNHQAYGDQIIPLRDQPPRPGWVPLGLVRVLDGYRNGDLNEPEAAQVAALIRDMCADPMYDGMTFGVISLLGTAQSKRIWELLYDQLGPDVLAQRQIRCGEAANFQGDERDVIVLTTVVARDPNAAGTRFSAMNGTAPLRRINVAASRARNQMWVVTSVDPQDLPVGDLRAELIRHCTAPPTVDERRRDLLADCESDFERRVVNTLQARGYRAIDVQHKVGQYRLDIVVAGPDGRLAIECDGDRWHGEDVWHRDRARQEVLERAGWTFERIRGSSFYRDSETAMQPVWQHLSDLGIPTGDEWMVTAPRGVTREVRGTPAEPPVARAHPTDTTAPAPSPAPEVASEPARRDSDVLVMESPEPSPDPDPVESPAPAWTPPPWYRPPPSPSAESTPAERVPLDDAEPASVLSSEPRTATLAPYRLWSPRPVPRVDSGSRGEIMDAMAEIIETEGPMHAQRVFQLYVRASGGARVRQEALRTFVAMTASGVRTGKWLRIHDHISSPPEATLYMPGHPPVIVRERGPRELVDIPRSEIRQLIDQLELRPGDPELKRAVLHELGLVRLTDRASDYLDQCLRYTWKT